MHVQEKKLISLTDIILSGDEPTMLAWIRSAPWEAVKDAKEPSFKAKVPEFYKGVRLYRMQAGGGTTGSLNSLELFIRKLSLQGVISKQELYPLSGHGNQPRYLTLKKTDMDNLGVGKHQEDEE